MERAWSEPRRTSRTSDRGDVLSLLDQSGAPFAAYRYDAWGRPIGSGNVGTGVWSQGTSLVSAQVATDIANRQILRYASYTYDGESGLYYLSSRTYDPVTRQFLSKDLSRNDGEESAYQYCRGNPVLLVDPTGYRVEIGGVNTYKTQQIVKAQKASRARATYRQMNPGEQLETGQSTGNQGALWSGHGGPTPYNCHVDWMGNPNIRTGEPSPFMVDNNFTAAAILGVLTGMVENYNGDGSLRNVVALGGYVVATPGFSASRTTGLGNIESGAWYLEMDVAPGIPSPIPLHPTYVWTVAWKPTWPPELPSVTFGPGTPGYSLQLYQTAEAYRAHEAVSSGR